MLDILYEDKFIVCCIKPKGVISEYLQGKTNCMPNLVKKQTNAYKIDVIHRLDKPVSGVMVFSKNTRATASLSKMVLNHQVIKEYLAVVGGEPESNDGTYCDILFKDSRYNKSFVVKSHRKGTKDAKLDYKLIQSVDTDKGRLSLVKIRLHTGRTHQIRVQFSSRKMPLVGDSKYGSQIESDIALFAYKLQFKHPLLKNNEVSVSALPNKASYPWSLFDFKDL